MNVIYPSLTFKIQSCPPLDILNQRNSIYSNQIFQSTPPIKRTAAESTRLNPYCTNEKSTLLSHELQLILQTTFSPDVLSVYCLQR